MGRRLIILLLTAALAVAACGGDEPAAEATDPAPAATTEPAIAETTEPTVAEATEPAPPTETQTEAETQPGATGEATTVAVASSELGDILVDGEGLTLYAFLNDEQGGPSTCSDDCAQNWPPVPGPGSAGTGADEGLLSTVERDDGSSQTVYNGWPLYYYAGDAEAGDVNGQGVGDVWFVMSPAGEPVQETTTADSTSTNY